MLPTHLSVLPEHKPYSGQCGNLPVYRAGLYCSDTDPGTVPGYQILLLPYVLRSVPQILCSHLSQQEMYPNQAGGHILWMFRHQKLCRQQNLINQYLPSLRPLPHRPLSDHPFFLKKEDGSGSSVPHHHH